ncbi:MAG: T9SS type A sorting domain-containing protein [Flavobacteriales bacterium]
MKKAILVSLFSVPCMLAAQSVLYTDDFESYAVGDMIAESNMADWSTWSAAPGGTEDGMISDAFAQSGSNSIAIIASGAGGGPNDLLLKLGNKTAGIYNLSFSLYIPSGKGGYFNLQHNENITPAEYAIDVTFTADGNAAVVTSGVTSVPIGTYPHDEWFSVSMDINLGTTTSSLVVASNAAYTWASNTSSNVATLNNKIGAIDFFAYAGGVDLGEMYIDDLTYSDNTSIGVAETLGTVEGAYPNPTRDAVTIALASPLSASATVQLRDVTGSLITIPVKVDGNKISTDLRSVPAGVYFLRVSDGTVQAVHRLVKN